MNLWVLLAAIVGCLLGCVQTPATDEYMDITARLHDLKDREIRLLEKISETADPERRAAFERELEALRGQERWYANRQGSLAADSRAEQVAVRESQRVARSWASRIVAAIIAIGVTTLRATA